jgi:site-specific DNA recombinase
VDAGVSGALYLLRPGLQSALEKLESGDANCLVIANLSRYSRDREHQEIIKKRVAAAKAKLVFCDMHFDDSPEGELAFNILGDFADYYREYVRQQTMKGRRRRANEGVQPARNHSPYGYHVVNKKDVISGTYPAESLGKYIVLEEQAKWVTQIFHRYASGDTLRGIARWLTNLGVPTPRGAVVWNQASMLRLLQHPVYKGTAPFARFERVHDESRVLRGCKIPYTLRLRPEEEWVYIDAPALIDEQTWQACQDRMSRNRELFRGRPALRYMLTGLFRCPKCKRKLRCSRRRTNRRTANTRYVHFYECRFARASTNLKGEVCQHNQYRGDWAEPLVITAIEKIAADPSLAAAALKAYTLRATRRDADLPIPDLKRQLKELERKEEATAKAQVAGIMAGANTSTYENLLQQIGVERRRLLQQLESIMPLSGCDNDTKNARPDKVVNQALRDLRNVLNAADDTVTPAEKQGLLSKVIDAIYPEKEGLRIELKPPYALSSEKMSSNVQYFTT